MLSLIRTETIDVGSQESSYPDLCFLSMTVIDEVIYKDG